MCQKTSCPHVAVQLLDEAFVVNMSDAHVSSRLMELLRRQKEEGDEADEPVAKFVNFL